MGDAHAPGAAHRSSVSRVSEEATGADAAEAGIDDAAEAEDLELGPAQDPVAVARRRHGAAGAVLAAGLFGVDIALGRKPREDIPVVVAAPSEPTDIDHDGIEIAVDEHTSVVAPALPRSEPARRDRRSRRSRRAR